MMTQKERIKEELRRGECEVVFTKKDGSERQMVCTLHPDYLPQRDPDEKGASTSSPEKEDTVVVWDIEAGAWRSFRIDSVVSGPTYVG
jgi:hypothetical protein